MQPRSLILSAIVAGLAMGAAFGQTMPGLSGGATEPAWRAAIQQQYRLAYDRAAPAYGQGPEDTTVSARIDLAAADGPYTLPPEYAAAERFAREEAKAAAEAERRYRLAYAKAMRPLPEPAAQAVDDAVVSTQGDAQPAAEPVEPQAKVIIVAALSDD